MKKNALTNAVIAGIAGVAGIASVANAVNLNPDGLGQVLVYPYYTVNGGNSTLVSIVNTTEFGKAVKVRFVEGYNSREVLDFNLYLSPFDVWTGAVFSLGATGPANLSTADNSCTAPRIKTNTALPVNNGLRYVAFRNYQYVTGATVANDDSGPNHLERTREGHLEVIEMGIVTNGDNDGDARGSLAAITHDSAGIPDNCNQIVNAWTSGTTDPYWLPTSSIEEGEIDIIPPTTANGGGGLFGSAGIVDAANGTQLTYVPDAIDGFSVRVLHVRPGTTSPSLRDARFDYLNPNSSSATADAIVFDNGQLQITSHTGPNAIDAVSAVYMHDALFNEYAVIADSAGTQILASEWVVTFPTKRFYVDQAIVGTTAIAPFTRIFPTTGSSGTAPVDVTLTYFDREERSPFTGVCVDEQGNPIDDPRCIDFSPTLPGQTASGPQLFWEAQVITFEQAAAVGGSSSILGSKLAQNVDLADGFTTGWMRLGLWADSLPFAGSRIQEHISRADLSGDRYVGLPATGFWAENTQTTSVLANFAGLWKHRGSRCLVPSGAIAASACPTL
jgi:hypothetical protein